MSPQHFRAQSELRKWLQKNHQKRNELWVGFYKKASGKGGIIYQEALDEALCFGWIDGVRKGVDELSYTIRFSPRKSKSIWSTININRAKELTRLGLMKDPGLAAFKQRDPAKSQRYSYENTRKLDSPYEARFMRNKKAWSFFESQPASYKRVASWWVMSAKREETRLRRLGTLIESSKKSERVIF